MPLCQSSAALAAFTQPLTCSFSESAREQPGEPSYPVWAIFSTPHSAHPFPLVGSFILTALQTPPQSSDLRRCGRLDSSIDDNEHLAAGACPSSIAERSAAIGERIWTLGLAGLLVATVLCCAVLCYFHAQAGWSLKWPPGATSGDGPHSGFVLPHRPSAHVGAPTRRVVVKPTAGAPKIASVIMM
jgi:hypothetical protein